MFKTVEGVQWRCSNASQSANSPELHVQEGVLAVFQARVSCSAAKTISFLPLALRFKVGQPKSLCFDLCKTFRMKYSVMFETYYILKIVEVRKAWTKDTYLASSRFIQDAVLTTSFGLASTAKLYSSMLTSKVLLRCGVSEKTAVQHLDVIYSHVSINLRLT